MTPSPRTLKMAKFNLLIYILHPYRNMIIFCNCHLNLNNFQIVCQSNISGKCYGFSNSNMTCCYETGHHFMSTVEDTGTKSMFITHFWRHNN